MGGKARTKEKRTCSMVLVPISQLEFVDTMGDPLFIKTGYANSWSTTIHRKFFLYKLTFAPPTKGNVLPPSDRNTVVVSTGFGPIRDPILQGLHVILAQSKEMECFLHVHQGTLI